MNLTFFGATQTVTGSQFLMEVNGKKILLECGLFQGRRNETYEKNQNFAFNPAEIDTLLLSHAHTDHSGNIPNLVKKGFKGPIYATPPTVDLSRILLRDSAFIQQKDIEWVNKIRAKHNEAPMVPLFTMGDAEKAMEQFVDINYDQPVTVAPGVIVTFRDAGHILGSSGILLEIDERGKKYRFGYAGDIGRDNMPIIHDPNRLRDLDILVMESTYGNRLHDDLTDAEEELADIIRTTSKSGGRVIVPSFAIGRTQRLVYMLHKLFDQGRIPEIPIYVDSPMVLNATEVFRKHPECFDRQTNRIFGADSDDPFGFRRLKYVYHVDDSKALNGLAFPHLIISSSGMAEGGRILHHLKNNIEKRNSLILFVGFAAQETLARKIMDGQKKIKIFGEEYKVKSAIRRMDCFSAHADRRGLLDYAKMTPPTRLKHIFLVHGEPDQSLPLRDGLRSMGYEHVYYPKMGQSFTLP